MKEHPRAPRPQVAVLDEKHHTSDESQGKGFCKPEIKDRQRWESTPHPYAFFNEDGHSVSFFGFFLRNLSIVDERNQNRVLHENILSQFLYEALIRNGVKFNQSLDKKSRLEKIADLGMVLGIEWIIDVDTSYELTNDNATISFSFVRQEDSGVYQCLVQNRAGTIVKLQFSHSAH